MSAPWLLAMMWRDICTAHWRVEPSRLEALLPPGLTLDRYEGDAWLSVVPFRMSGIHMRFAPVLPGFADVPEINLRTYVRAGTLRGIYFFSLDAASPRMVRAARFTTGLPYRLARIAMSDSEAEIRYRSERIAGHGPRGVFEARFEPDGIVHEALPGSLGAFLHERYRFFTYGARRLWSGIVLHEPWPLQAARIEIGANTLASIAGITLPPLPERCYFARALTVRATAVMPLGQRY